MVSIVNNFIDNYHRFSYIQVSVESTDQLINPNNSDRKVGKVMISQNPRHLSEFFENPDEDLSSSMRMSK